MDITGPEHAGRFPAAEWCVGAHDLRAMCQRAAASYALCTAPPQRSSLFGSEPRVRRPVVLLVVFGVLLVLVGVTATAQAAMVSTYASTSAISSTVDGDVGTLRTFV